MTTHWNFFFFFLQIMIYDSILFQYDFVTIFEFRYLLFESIKKNFFFFEVEYLSFEVNTKSVCILHNYELILQIYEIF